MPQIFRMGEYWICYGNRIINECGFFALGMMR